MAPILSGQATKVARDGSGSSSGSRTETVKVPFLEQHVCNPANDSSGPKLG